MDRYITFYTASKLLKPRGTVRTRNLRRTATHQHVLNVLQHSFPATHNRREIYKLYSLFLSVNARLRCTADSSLKVDLLLQALSYHMYGQVYDICSFDSTLAKLTKNRLDRIDVDDDFHRSKTMHLGNINLSQDCNKLVNLFRIIID